MKWEGGGGGAARPAEGHLEAAGFGAQCRLLSRLSRARFYHYSGVWSEVNMSDFQLGELGH